METKTAAPQKEEKEWVKKFRQELVIAGYSPRTLTMYTLYLDALLNHAKKEKEPKDINREDIVGFMANMKEKGASNATIALVHAALKYFFKTYLKLNTLDDIKIPKKAKALPVVLTKDEVRALLKATKL